ncbi:MAG: hypothetical protein ACE5IQ_08505 [Candidatus Methylomirabilales bacterium]
MQTLVQAFRLGKTIVVTMLALWLSAPAPAWAVECRFTHETATPPSGPEQTTFITDCPLPLPVEPIWTALQDFPRLAEKGVRPTEVEYARALDSEAAKRAVAARLNSLPLARKPDVSRLLALPLDGPLLYEEFYHVNLYFLWGVRRFAADTSQSAAGIYRLTFEKVDGLSSEAVFRGGFELTQDGDRSRLRYTLTLSIHEKLAGEGLLDLLQRAVMGRMYVEGYRTYMKERVEGIVREAQRLGRADGSRGE